MSATATLSSKFQISIPKAVREGQRWEAGQEFNREANTLGSKSVANEITRISVELKVLIEQMREQVQNIE